MMAKFNMSSAQYDELRRLTKKANRRIIAFTEKYEAEGLKVIPYDVTGGVIQSRKQWHSSKTPLSRGKGQFKTAKDFERHIRWLREFDKPNIRPTLTRYTSNYQKRTENAIITSLGSIKDTEQKMLSKMSPAELSKFWHNYQDISRRLGPQYSSDQAMTEALEIYTEDRDHLMNKASA